MKKIKGNFVNVSLEPGLAELLEYMAAREHRSASGMLRFAMNQYSMRTIKTDGAELRQNMLRAAKLAKKQGITLADVLPSGEDKPES